MQCFWYVPTGELWRVDYQRLEDQPDDATSNTTPQVTAMDGMSNYAISPLAEIDGSALLQCWAASVCTGCCHAAQCCRHFLLPRSMTLCPPAVCTMHVQAHKAVLAAGAVVRFTSRALLHMHTCIYQPARQSCDLNSSLQS